MGMQTLGSILSPAFPGVRTALRALLTPSSSSHELTSGPACRCRMVFRLTSSMKSDCGLYTTAR